jgi:hypothetical protein
MREQRHHRVADQLGARQTPEGLGLRVHEAEAPVPIDEIEGFVHALEHQLRIEFLRRRIQLRGHARDIDLPALLQA